MDAIGYDLVPEPSPSILLGLGLLTVVTVHRRRRTG
jgi:hypothetical protein